MRTDKELFTQGLRFTVRNFEKNFCEIAFACKAANRLAAVYFEICHEDASNFIFSHGKNANQNNFGNCFGIPRNIKYSQKIYRKQLDGGIIGTPCFYNNDSIILKSDIYKRQNQNVHFWKVNKMKI